MLSDLHIPAVYCHSAIIFKSIRDVPSSNGVNILCKDGCRINIENSYC